MCHIYCVYVCFQKAINLVAQNSDISYDSIQMYAKSM